MKIKTVIVSPIDTNCYIVIDEKSKEALIIDPGDDAGKILPELKGLKVEAIVITHNHWDHVGALDSVQKATGAPVLNPLREGDEVRVGKIVFKVIHTPGHTEDSLCLYTPGHLFSGDTLFRKWHGAVHFPGGSMQKMKGSLERLATLPDDTKVYPGHHESTTIGREKEEGSLA
jgi:hydroxyacylglutathione hydrolase